MNAIEQMKFTLVLPPISANNGDYTGNTYVDTKGWSHVRFLLVTGSLSSAVGSTAEGTAPYVEQCDTSDGSYTTVSSAALADAISDSEDDSMFAIDVDLTKLHKRYMRVNAPHAGVGADLLAIIAILSKKDSGPAFGGGASEAGLAEKISA